MKPDYMVITSWKVEELASMVKNMLRQRWGVVGGVAVYGFPGGREYSQAMIFPAPTETKEGTP